jgi:hypothetical protein
MSGAVFVEEILRTRRAMLESHIQLLRSSPQQPVLRSFFFISFLPTTLMYIGNMYLSEM